MTPQPIFRMPQPYLTGYIGYFPFRPTAINNGSVLPRRELFREILVALAIVALSVHSAAGARPVQAHTVIDQDYIAALAAANRFLQAWQSQDHETVVLLLTDKVKQHTKEEALDAFFAPSPRTQQAYEISSGKKLAPGRYVFAVTLFNSGAAKPAHRFSRLIVTRAGKNDWAIDKLP